MGGVSVLHGQAPVRRAPCWLAWTAAALLASGCLVDEDARCGANQVLWADARCVCAEGYAPSAGGCVPCGEHEVPDPVNGCACEAGYARASAGASCTALAPDVLLPSGAGTPCTSEADCAAFDASYCDLLSQSCVVKNCTLAPDSCAPGFVCCDLTAVPVVGLTLCLQPGSCLP